MVDTWWFNLVVYLMLFTVYTQFYKKATKKSKNDGALTIILQFLGGAIVLLLVPLFKFQFPSDVRTYIFLGIACAFYALSDRLNTTARRGLEVSVHSILGQLNTVFVVIWGIIFFKEGIIPIKLLGALLIVAGNVAVLYKKGKFEWNKYVLFSLIANVTMSIGISIDVGISDQFNLPFYVAMTLIVPSLFILLVERVKFKTLTREIKHGDKKSILLVGVSWGTMLVAMLRAYQFGSVTTIAPLCALTTIINVFVAYFALKERNSIVRKAIAAIIAVIGILLIKL